MVKVICFTYIQIYVSTYQQEGVEKFLIEPRNVVPNINCGIQHISQVL